jgi:hypothetical protein
MDPITEFVDYSDNAFVLTEGDHFVSIRKYEFEDYNINVKIKKGKLVDLKCKLVKKIIRR